jgi:hypothetical protein
LSLGNLRRLLQRELSRFFSLIFVIGMSEMRGLPPSGHVNENIDADSWVLGALNENIDEHS